MKPVTLLCYARAERDPTWVTVGDVLAVLCIPDSNKVPTCTLEQP